MRVQGRDGVYGLISLGCEHEGTWGRKGYFDLKYVPVPEESAFEAFSTLEQLTRLNPSFELCLRQSPEGEDPLVSAFSVGRICLCVDAEEENLFISLWAPDRWREIQQEGLRLLESDGTEHELVPRGGMDRNVPAFALAWSFYHRFVSSCAYVLEQPPLFVLLQSRPAAVSVLSSDADPIFRDLPGIRDKFLTVGFGPPAKPGEPDPRREWVRAFRPDHWPPLPDPTTLIIWDVSEHGNIRRGHPLWWKIGLGSSVDLKMSRLPAHRPPLVVVTGFLGTGKTTLVNQIVEWKALGHYRFAAVVQNDFGEVAVDGRLADGAFNTVEITEGCVCCSHSGELTRAVRKICAEYQPDIVIVETTGLSDPEALIRELPDLAPHVRFDSLVTLVDASTFHYVLNEHHVVRKQIEAADLIILNKLDLLRDREIGPVREAVSALNSRAPVVATVGAKMNPELLFSGSDRFFQPSTRDAGQETGLAHAHSGHDHPIRRGHLDADPIQTTTIELPGLLGREQFTDFLRDLPWSVYRLKGVLAFAGERIPQMLQYVAGRHDIQDFPETELTPNILVFIGREIDRDNLRAALERCVVQDIGKLP